VAETVAFFASDDSGFTTGHYIPVNGGVAMD
jgi:3-oxoacyl-[acyl-carrier protein] reductase